MMKNNKSKVEDRTKDASKDPKQGREGRTLNGNAESRRKKSSNSKDSKIAKPKMMKNLRKFKIIKSIRQANRTV